MTRRNANRKQRSSRRRSLTMVKIYKSGAAVFFQVFSPKKRMPLAKLSVLSG
jgi:hypothetical protein